MFLHVISAVMQMFLHLTSAAMQMIFAILKTSQHVISSSSTYMKKKKKEISTGFPIDIQRFLLSMIFGICTTTSTFSHILAVANMNPSYLSTSLVGFISKFKKIN